MDGAHQKACLRDLPLLKHETMSDMCILYREDSKIVENGSVCLLVLHRRRMAIIHAESLRVPDTKMISFSVDW